MGAWELGQHCRDRDASVWDADIKQQNILDTGKKKYFACGEPCGGTMGMSTEGKAMLKTGKNVSRGEPNPERPTGQNLD